MRYLMIIIFLGGVIAGVSPVLAQDPVTVADVRITYSFGEVITFSASVNPFEDIQSMTLFIRFASEGVARTFDLEVHDGVAVYDYVIEPGLLRPFEKIVFWFDVQLKDGRVVSSQQFSFKYADDRFDWQILKNDVIHLHWYQGDAVFGQMAFEMANLSLQRIAGFFPVHLTQPIEMYVYASQFDMQTALDNPDLLGLVGHASPDLGVLLVTIQPGAGQEMAMAQQIPHEMAHALLYRYAGREYYHLPTWLNEGIASLSEQFPNPEFLRALQLSSEKKMLMPLADLCPPFPRDAARAYLAYAQSDSFTRFLYAQYGAESLVRLIDAYVAGASCEQGVEQTFGVSLLQLEYQWRETVLGENVTWVALRNLAPYIMLALLILLVPFWQVRVSGKERRDD